MDRFSPARAALTLVLITSAMVGLTGRVAYLQTYGREQTIRKAERQQHQNEVLFARRGSIFDTTGLLMAGTVQTQCLFIDPKFMQDQFQADGRSLVDMDKAIEKLAHLLDKDRCERAESLPARYRSRYIRVADHLDERTVNEI